MTGLHHAAGEAESACLFDQDVHQLSLELGGSFEECKFVSPGPAHELRWILGIDPFHQDFLHPPSVPLRTFLGHLLDHPIDPLKPVLLDEIGHLIVPFGRRGHGPGGVGGRVDEIEPDLLDEGDGVHELLFRLSGESDDDVGAEGGVRHVLAYVLDDAQVPFPGVSPFHGLENVVVPGLERDVEVLAHLGQFVAGFDQPIGKVTGMGGGESDAFDPRRIVHVIEQIGEPPPLRRTVLLLGHHGVQVPPVGIDVLPQEGDLLVSCLSDRVAFPSYGVGFPALFHSPHVGHHAVAAPFVAPVDDVDPCGGPGIPPGDGDVFFDVYGFDGAHLLSELHLFQEATDTIGVVRSHDQVEFRHPAQQRFPFLGRHASRHHDFEVRLFAFPFGLDSERRVDFLFCLVSYGARVVDEHVRPFRIIAVDVSGRFQVSCHAFCVGFVHLAPPGVDVVLFLALCVLLGCFVGSDEDVSIPAAVEVRGSAMLRFHRGVGFGLRLRPRPIRFPTTPSLPVDHPSVRPPPFRSVRVGTTATKPRFAHHCPADVPHGRGHGVGAHTGSARKGGWTCRTVPPLAPCPSQTPLAKGGGERDPPRGGGEGQGRRFDPSVPPSLSHAGKGPPPLVRGWGLGGWRRIPPSLPPSRVPLASIGPIPCLPSDRSPFPSFQGPREERDAPHRRKQGDRIHSHTWENDANVDGMFRHQPGFFVKPENALKRAEELEAVGQTQAALKALHDVLTSRRHRSWSNALEGIMMKYIDLCVELRKGRFAKDGLIQFRQVCQTASMSSLEDVIQHFMEKATQKAVQASEMLQVKEANETKEKKKRTRVKRCETIEGCDAKMSEPNRALTKPRPRQPAIAIRYPRPGRNLRHRGPRRRLHARRAHAQSPDRRKTNRTHRSRNRDALVQVPLGDLPHRPGRAQEQQQSGTAVRHDRAEGVPVLHQVQEDHRVPEALRSHPQPFQQPAEVQGPEGQAGSQLGGNPTALPGNQVRATQSRVHPGDVARGVPHRGGYP
eukprot:scaffold60_cov325-Pavlova_lutheri.AAC.22